VRKTERSPRNALSHVDRAYESIRRAIIEGDYPPGFPLRLHALAREHGVSLIPIREALRRLQVERLVETVPNKGARVANLSIEDVTDAYKTRIVLEVGALREAFPKLDREMIGQAKRVKDEMVKAFKAGDAERGYQLHRDIHFCLYEQSQSPWLLYLIEILWSHTERYRRLATHLQPSYEYVGEEHAKVLKAIEHGDIEEATEALRLDLQHTSDVIVAAHLRRAG
jgi:DNA-binding GntR family transcriptional regulator